MKQKKRARDIRAKLISAVCMLMVSVIMLTSTTYAWFTLSTAPEVKGIQTSVGANGNLEMALLSTNESFTNTDNIPSGTGDSSAVQGAVKANVTWGNLVDLSSDSYGLSLIKLMPSKLFKTDAGGLNDTMLQIPLYGADGRVSTLTSQGIIVAPYAKNGFTQVDTSAADYSTSSTIEYGVRGVGVATNQTVRQAAYNNALSTANAAASEARTAAIGSLNAYSGKLANVAMSGAGSGFTEGDKQVIQELIWSLMGRDIVDDPNTQDVNEAQHIEGVLDKVKTALAYYHAAAFASKKNPNTYSDDEFRTALENQRDALLNVSVNSLTALENSYSEAVKESITQLVAVVQTLSTAQNALTEGNTGIAVNALFSKENMKIWDWTVDYVLEDNNNDGTYDHINEITQKFAAEGGTLVVNMGGGVYSQLANLVDTFSGTAPLSLPGVGSITATMKANKTLNTTAIFPKAKGELTNQTPEADGNASAVITDAYGYIIDMAFRTNASGSKLQLQTSGISRVGIDTNLQGAGSTMTFTSVAGFPVESMKELMKSIKVVFFSPDVTGNPILATAMLDTANAAVSGNTVTAPLKIQTTVDAVPTLVEDGVITDMPQNHAKKVSALVYLDGETVTNADVGTGASSMFGTVNFQFSSSAELSPMTYSAGYAAAVEPTTGNQGGTEDENQGGGTATTQYDVTTNAPVENVTITADAKATANQTYTFTVTPADTYTATVTVSVGGTTVEPTISGTTYTIPADKVTGNITINVTAAAAG